MQTGTCQDFGYVPDERWAQLAARSAWIEVAAVATDSRDRVYVFNRGPQPVMVYSAAGELLRTWGAGLFERPHGLFVGPDDAVYCTDDAGHTVQKFSPEGQLLMTIGERGRPSSTGATSVDFRTIRQSAGPFHYPTNVALAPNGDLLISDGYGNARIHRFTAAGKLLASWGAPGNGPGEFHVPHGIAVDRAGTVYVADRENSRIQLFAANGSYLGEWPDVARPCQVFIDSAARVYVAELGYRAGMWPGTAAPAPDATGGRLSIFNMRGELLARWGGGENPCAAGDFFAPHDLCVDSQGSIYLAEVVMSAGGNRGLVPATCHALQKFVRQS